jgi:hypothetical protein
VTTLEPSSGEGWRPSDDPGDPFTPVGVIGGRGVKADEIPGGTLGVAPPDPTVDGQPTTSAKPGASSVKGGVGWLPEPATWALLIIGLAMIGFALRGLWAARRRLTRLEETDS